MKKTQSAALLSLAFLTGIILSATHAVAIVHELCHAVGYLVTGNGVDLHWSYVGVARVSVLGLYAGPYGELIVFWSLTVLLLAKQKAMLAALAAGILVANSATTLFSEDFVIAQEAFGQSAAVQVIAWILLAGLLVGFAIGAFIVWLWKMYKTRQLTILPHRVILSAHRYGQAKPQRRTG